MELEAMLCRKKSNWDDPTRIHRGKMRQMKFTRLVRETTVWMDLEAILSREKSKIIISYQSLERSHVHVHVPPSYNYIVRILFI
jgi:hypothetical protein